MGAGVVTNHPMVGAKGHLMSLLQCTIASAALPYAVTHILRTPPPPPRSITAGSLCIPVMNQSQHHSTTTITAAAGGVAELEDACKQKRAVRVRVKKELKNMCPVTRSEQDAVIQNIILEAPWFKSCKRLCAYISCSALREVDTSNILKAILHSPDGQSTLGKKLYVPRVEDRDRNMRMFHISRINDLIANSMNILEPAPVDAEGNEREDVMLAKEPVDLLLLPGLAFDKTGRRLGRGGGYYDTFLSRYQELAKERNWKQPLLVALSYSVQIMEEGVIPITPTDIPVDALVTPSGVIPVNPAAFDICR